MSVSGPLVPGALRVREIDLHLAPRRRGEVEGRRPEGEGRTLRSSATTASSATLAHICRLVRSGWASPSTSAGIFQSLPPEETGRPPLVLIAVLASRSRRWPLSLGP